MKYKHIRFRGIVVQMKNNVSNSLLTKPSLNIAKGKSDTPPSAR